MIPRSAPPRLRTERLAVARRQRPHCVTGGDRIVPSPVKVEKVDEIARRFRESRSVVLTNYRGLTVADVTDLRRQLRAEGAQFHVVKNTLALRAARDLGLGDLEPFLTGPTALALGIEDPVAPARILSQFIRTHRDVEMKGGVLEGRVIDAQGVRTLASLPGRPELLGRVAYAFASPLAGFAGVLTGLMRSFALAVRALEEKRAGAEAQT